MITPLPTRRPHRDDLLPEDGGTPRNLRGVAPPEVKTSDIYRGIIPFVILQLLSLAVFWSFPGLSTWLPNRMLGR